MILKFAYIALTIAMLFVICFIGFKTIDKTFVSKTTAKNKKIMLVLGLLIWHVYIFIMATSGILQTYELPPRFPLFLILPTFLFTAIFLYKNRNNNWIKNIPPSSLIYVQSFRILVETLFVFSISSQVLPKLVTIEGYNFDMFIGFSAPLIAYLVFNKKRLSKNIAILWNYLGLLVLASVIFLFLSATYFPELYNSKIPLISFKATMYPFVLVAAFLMPLAVFLHVLSLVQLTKRS